MSAPETTETPKDSEDAQNVRRAFELFDKDNDGRITAGELGDVLRSIGQEPTQTELDDMISEFDSKSSGGVDLEDFEKLVGAYANRPGDERQMREAFNVFDKDGKGYVTEENLGEALKQMGESVTGEDLKEMVMVADKNNDGKIDFEEFVEILRGKSL